MTGARTAPAALDDDLRTRLDRRFGRRVELRTRRPVLAPLLAEADATWRLRAIRPEPPVADYLLLKLASRCNIRCTYCYWFTDPGVLHRPPVMTPETVGRLLLRLSEHVEAHGLDSFHVLFHGGEPLLFGKDRFRDLVDRLHEVGRRTGCRISTSVTTNGLLVDDEWAALLAATRTAVTVSVDGSQRIHDGRRIDARGRGTWEGAVDSLALLRTHGVEPGVLAVCDPASDPADVLAALVDDHGVTTMDVLPPDATHDGPVDSIESYYRRLFDLWFDHYADRGVSVRHLRAMVVGLLGGHSRFEGIGPLPVQVVTIGTDGALEPLDVLRITGGGSTSTGLELASSPLQAVVDDPLWRRAFDLSLDLAEVCRGCRFRTTCAGGFLPHRWSTARGYDNPSVYCADLEAMLEHVARRLVPELDVVTGRGLVPLAEVMGDG